MSKVSVFFNSNHAVLADELDQWLQQNAGRIEIEQISMDSNQHGHCLAILYQERKGPGYRSHVWFNWRHNGLEDLANATLEELHTANAKYVALGSNQLGHCLCVIEVL